jgi:hypothetical protein
MSSRAKRALDPEQEQPASKRRQIEDGEKIQWALERFGPLRDGKRLKSVKAIATAHKRKPVIVTRGILQAFREGWVEIREAPRPVHSSERLVKLEEQLACRYQLQGAVVPSMSNLSQDPSVQTDQIHHCLGEAFARFLSGSPGFFRPQDVLGFGSGRAVYHFVEALSHCPPLRVGGITLASVTGALHARDYAGALGAVCDSDFHTNLCSLSVVGNPRPQMRFMHTLLASSPERRDAELAMTWLRREEWKKSPVSHLICGTGVLVKGHRLHLSPKSDREASKREEIGLEPVATNLRELSRIADSITAKHPGYHPVGDICNFLFYIVNPEVPEYASEIRGLIDDINKCLLNVQEEQLFDIDTIMMIAGTARKNGAIAQLLTPDPFRRGGAEKKKLNIKYLCTCQDTAEWLNDRAAQE